MKVSIITLSNENSSVPLLYAKAIARGLEKNGVQSDIFSSLDGEMVHFGLYDYLVVVAETKSKFSPSFNGSLNFSSSGLSRLHGGAVVVNTFRKVKAMQNLMKIMESEGIIVNESEFLKKEIDGEFFGKKLNIKRRAM